MMRPEQSNAARRGAAPEVRDAVVGERGLDRGAGLDRDAGLVCAREDLAHERGFIGLATSGLAVEQREQVGLCCGQHLLALLDAEHDLDLARLERELEFGGLLLGGLEILGGLRDLVALGAERRGDVGVALTDGVQEAEPSHEVGDRLRAEEHLEHVEFAVAVDVLRAFLEEVRLRGVRVLGVAEVDLGRREARLGGVEFFGRCVVRLACNLEFAVERVELRFELLKAGLLRGKLSAECGGFCTQGGGGLSGGGRRGGRSKRRRCEHETRNEHSGDGARAG